MVSGESCLCLTCSSDNIITALPVEELMHLAMKSLVLCRHYMCSRDVIPGAPLLVKERLDL